jgi:hypothetical protein
MKLFMGYTTFLDQIEQHFEQYHEDDYPKDRPDQAPYHAKSRAENKINPVNAFYRFW